MFPMPTAASRPSPGTRSQWGITVCSRARGVRAARIEGSAMRIVATGATGNLGSSVVERLARDPRVADVIGVARRTLSEVRPKTQYGTADVAYLRAVMCEFATARAPSPPIP